MDVIMSHWVGGIDKVPGRPLPICLNAELCLRMYADPPKLRGYHDLRLSSPDSVCGPVFQRGNEERSCWRPPA